MADLRISELAALAGGDLAAGDLLAIADISASETKKITVTDLVGNATTLIADATIPGAKILFSAGTIPGSSVATGGISATQLANDSVTAAKLADESSVDLVTTLPASGAFVGQIALDTDDGKIYCWNGTSWVNVKAAGSINSVVGDSTGIVNISVSTVGDTVTVSTTLDNTSAAAQFLAGPTGSAGIASYRTIAANDLPTATTSAKGAVIVNGNGLTLSGSTIAIDNTVTSSATRKLVTYNANGLVTGGAAIGPADLPIAAAGTVGAVKPGTGLNVDINGFLNHTNSVASTTGTKITYDAQGHVTASAALEAADIPDIDATKITSGTLPTERIADGAIVGNKLGNYAVTTIGETQPTAEHVGQFFFNPLTRDLSLWDGNVYQPVGISAGEIVLAGTYNANTNLLDSVTADGAAAGFTNGASLPAASTLNNRYYVVVSQVGTGTAPAPTVTLEPPDILLSNGTSYILIETSETITSQIASNVGFTPYGNISGTNVQSAIAELDDEKVAKAGGTMTGDLVLNNVNLVFEGATVNDYETTVTVVDPTADRTITLPDVSGTVLTTGSTSSVTSAMIVDGTIVDGDINASAGIAFSKLATLTSGNIIVGSISNVATSVAVTGDVTISNNGVTAISSGAIVNADINASAAIAYSKLAPLTSGNILIGSGSNVATGVAVTGDITISNAGVTAIAAGAVVDADISASAEIAVSKLADGTARQLLQTDAAGTGVEWTSNVDIPGTLDVTGAAAFDSTVTIGGSAALVASAIGSTVQAYDADTAKYDDTTANFTGTLQNGGSNVVVDSDIGVTVQAYDADTAKLDVVQTFTAVQTLTDPAIIGTILEDVYTITDGAAFEVNPGNGSVQLVTLGANRTPKATNFAAGEAVTLMVADGTAYTLTWTDTTWGTSGVVWTGGSAPTLATSGYTVIQFWKVGSQVYGATVGDVA